MPALSGASTGFGGPDMTPPKSQGQGSNASTPAGSSAVSLCVMRKRADFLKAASAKRQGTGGFLLQARDRADGTDTVRIGFTASKKIGNAVLRNRAKRRLRALAREGLPGMARHGWDYVLVARPEATVSRPYDLLCADLAQALRSVHPGTP